MGENENELEELETAETETDEVDVESIDMEALGVVDEAAIEVAAALTGPDEDEKEAEGEEEDETPENTPDKVELIRQEITKTAGDTPALLGKLSDLSSLQTVFILKIIAGKPLTAEEQQMAVGLLAKIESGEITLPFAAKGLSAEQVISESADAFNKVSQVFAASAQSTGE
ncbi:MAG: hypothetical protein L3J67_13000 [Hyphomicrobiaceae bacterium]|nr:hypothetical protein [Hyphomicrobiaceae bacterium]